MTAVKLCGLTSVEDVRAVLTVKPDYAGTVLSAGFRRTVEYSFFAEMSAMLEGSGIKRVGVFVNEHEDSICERFADKLDLIQLHGNEDNDYIRRIKERTGKPVIKAFTVRSSADISAAGECAADFVLLDSGTGTGKAFDYSLIKGISRPFFLAGGLNPDNVAEAVREFAPFAVDTSSGIETNGKKDITKMSAFLKAVRSAAVL